MLSANTQKIIRCLKPSFNISTRPLAVLASLADPLEGPLEDSAVTPPNLEDVQITKLENGIKVASCDHGGAVSTVVVAAQAGSRYESINQLGVSHLMKNAAFSSNGGISQLGMVRETQEMGGYLDCSSSREFISRKSIVLRKHLQKMLSNILPGISHPLFHQWELTGVKERCKGDLATLDCAAKNMELLHGAAFRNGLGNSLYCDEIRLGNISPEHLLQFAEQYYVGEGLTIVGTNVNHDELVQYSSDLLGKVPSGELDVPAIQQYRGGEVRNHTSNGLTYVSLVGPGAGLCSADLPAFAVLQRILGDSTHIKWGSNTVSSRLEKAVKSVTQDPFQISSLNISYSDAGLFGLNAISTPSGIGTVLEAGVAEILGIANGDLSPEDVTRAKTQAKAMVLMSNEGSDEHIDDLLRQVVFTGGYVSPAQTSNNIDAVSLEKVVEVAKQMLYSAKPTLAVTGNSAAAPYLDDL